MLSFFVKKLLTDGASPITAIDCTWVPSPVTRSVVLKLLLAEEEMLGLTREQLARIDRHIAKLRRIIDQQQKRIDRSKFIGLDSERALLLQATLNDLMATYQLHRRRITAALSDGEGT